MTEKRLLVLLAVALLFASVAVAWAASGWPPPGMLLRHGGTAPAPTGRVARVEGMEFVEIGPGFFRMGSDVDYRRASVARRLAGELGIRSRAPARTRWSFMMTMPLRWVEFPRGFWIARYEVTRGVYGKEGPADHPATNLTWEEMRDWCAAVAARTGLPIRLPSEAEWECACRGGTTTEYFFGDDPEGIGPYAHENPPGEPSLYDVGITKPNPWGLYDFIGNAQESCADTFHLDYSGLPADGTAWTEGGLFGERLFRVVRGSSGRAGVPEFARSAARSPNSMMDAWDLRGFRPAFVLSEGEERLVAPYLVEE